MKEKSNLTSAVRYFSRGGNAKKVAQAIAEEVHVKARAIPEPPEGKVDVLFLGTSVYAAGVDEAVRRYIDALNSSMVGKVVVFSTAAIKTSAYPQMKKLLEGKGIEVSEEEFHCRGQFTALHRGHPDENDLKNARKFARQIVRG